MRKVTYSLGVSLDGYIASTDGSIDWSDPGDDLHQFHIERTRRVGTSLYGRRLYENMAAYWPTADEDPEASDFIVEFARLWRAIPRVVFSTTLTEVGHNSRLVRGNVVEEVNALKAQSGGEIEVGGAGLGASLIRLGLIDEYAVWVFPVILGGGTPFFPTLDKRIELRLLETQEFSGGIVYSHYSAEV
ncbi:dihydrofolate reductase [Murinocardiopsis flavida]|uniref:Dihydrofolate reductase n=1 Tax=Murinocardiopsis flavida TaxID=645275 RepID=A0A2P8D3J3_9ACTN|nr:dihydrofolate reductase family protein [Murinocardiopsis flavida]PSK91756.1 dihydrofolate reductase [Murinocardiopsis flavida]